MKTAAKDANDTPDPLEGRPITLASPISGLHLRLKPGSSSQIPGTNRYEMRHGSWAMFQRGHYKMLPSQFIGLFGSRAAATAWLKAHPRYGRDFAIVPDQVISAPEETKTTK